MENGKEGVGRGAGGETGKKSGEVIEGGGEGRGVIGQTVYT